MKIKKTEIGNKVLVEIEGNVDINITTSVSDSQTRTFKDLVVFTVLHNKVLIETKRGVNIDIATFAPPSEEIDDDGTKYEPKVLKSLINAQEG